MKKKKWFGKWSLPKIVTGITALGGWLNWIHWLIQRKKCWPKEKMNTKTLHSILYRCPSCQTEFRMDSKGKHIWCLECGKKWEMNRQGRLRSHRHPSEFAHILDWISWEKECVSEEIQNRTYHFEDTIRIESPKRGSKPEEQGIAHFVQTPYETRLTCAYGGEEYTMIRTGKSLEKLYVSYNHLGKGDCFEFPTFDGILRCYPARRDVVTKLSYATEEIYNRSNRRS